jgi:serine/threonine protein kinase
LNYVIQLTEALGHLHTHQIIHKDIKPKNIIVNPKIGIVKITDFGIATQLSRETQQVSNPELLEGTLAYMSPEQTGRMNRAIDYRTDFYSLGVSFYEMLTSTLPFTSNDPLETGLLPHCPSAYSSSSAKHRDSSCLVIHCDETSLQKCRSSLPKCGRT